MSESFNFEYCRCRTCGYEWRKGLNGSHSCAENLQRQLEEEKKDHEISFKCSVDYQNAYEEEKKKLAEARGENEKLTNKNTLLAEGNRILMQQLKEKGDE